MLRVVALVLTSVPTSPECVAVLGGVTIAPLLWLTRNAGHLRAVLSGEASFGHSARPIGSWRTAGVFHVPRFGFATVGVAPRRFSGNSNVVALAGDSSAEGSLERPSHTQMEPSRPPVLCDPVAAARGSFAIVGLTERSQTNRLETRRVAWVTREDDPANSGTTSPERSSATRTPSATGLFCTSS